MKRLFNKRNLIFLIICMMVTSSIIVISTMNLHIKNRDIVTVLLFFCCFILAIISVSLSEVLWHNILFHSGSKIGKLISSIWNYDPKTHLEHHQNCCDQMEDKVVLEEKYWVQRPSNVAAAFLVAFAIEAFLILIVRFPAWTYLATFLLTAAAFTFWYKFEDHFHLGMHKKKYYEEKIKNTWQNKWFLYTKRCHAIHHRNGKCNLGFVFFPIGDLLIGTYKHRYKNAVKKIK